MTHDQGTGGDFAERARIERTLADYPNLTSDRLEELIRWFRHDASALDIALIASNEAIVEPYRRFRADHIDPVKGRDVAIGLMFLCVIAAVFLTIIWRAL